MYKTVYKEWLKSDKLREEEKTELSNLTDEKDIEFRFGKNLEFGTAGMRGLLGLGTNMINVYMVRFATQALAEYIKSLGKSAVKRGVVISYDTRRLSFEFALDSAIVLASNGINVHLFDNVHPVPMLSYAVREMNKVAGIMITASHNPKEYNGYKIYGEDGAQMTPEALKAMLGFMSKIKDPLSDDVCYYVDHKKYIKYVPKRIDRKYYKEIIKLSLSRNEVKEEGKNIKLVYTPVHGSGYVPVTTILKKMKINATLVPEQVKPDTEFSTVEVPNPEYQETLSLAIKMADFKGADVVFGTDPDCDRLGVALRNEKGKFVTLSGNQTGILLLDYVLRRLSEENKLDKKCFVVKSFVTTSLAKLIADYYGVELIEVPVGFKYIGEKIKQLDDFGDRKFVFGFEESCGYLRGKQSRDKDAVVASMLFAEMVCYYNYHNKSIFERLKEIYKQNGYVIDKTSSTVYSGLNAMKDMNAVVEKLKKTKIEKIGEVEVVARRDYSSLTRLDKNGKTEKIDCSPANAVYYELEGGSFVCVRPSGTEPKLKVYYSIKSASEKKAKAMLETIQESFVKNL